MKTFTGDFSLVLAATATNDWQANNPATAQSAGLFHVVIEPPLACVDRGALDGPVSFCFAGCIGKSVLFVLCAAVLSTLILPASGFPLSQK